MFGELSGKMRSTPTPYEILRTVNVDRAPFETRPDQLFSQPALDQAPAGVRPREVRLPALPLVPVALAPSAGDVGRIAGDLLAGDVGDVGRGGGRTVAALRTVVKAAAVRDGQRVLVDVVD